MDREGGMVLHTAGTGVGPDAPAPGAEPGSTAGPTAGATPGPSGTRSRFAPLDGIRALAVTAVILFHASPSWAIGGFYGVDLFFILSGYLITSLLLAEWQRSGGIALRAILGPQGPTPPAGTLPACSPPSAPPPPFSHRRWAPPTSSATPCRRWDTSRTGTSSPPTRITSRRCPIRHRSSTPGPSPSRSSSTSCGRSSCLPFSGRWAAVARDPTSAADSPLQTGGAPSWSRSP